MGLLGWVSKKVVVSQGSPPIVNVSGLETISRLGTFGRSQKIRRCAGFSLLVAGFAASIFKAALLEA
jgi:hypothetical protein